MKPNSGRLLIWGLIILVCSAFEVEAAGVTLAWDPASSPNIAGYRLHSGTTSGVYSQTIELGNATSTLVSNLVTGKTYFFVVTAYNTMGVESAPSNEVSYLAPPTTGPAPTVTPTPTPKATATPTATPTPTPTPGTAVMLSPPPGSTFSSSSVTFTWSAGNATNYFLFVGSSLHGADIYNSGIVTVHSKTVNNIPTDGRTIYVTLGSQVNGSWTYKNYSYKAF